LWLEGPQAASAGCAAACMRRLLPLPLRTPLATWRALVATHAHAALRHATPHDALPCAQGVLGALDTARAEAQHLFNLGNTHPHTVSDLVAGLERALGKRAVRLYVDLPNLGDVLQTHSNISAAHAAFNYSPEVRRSRPEHPPDHQDAVCMGALSAVWAW
jgi:hypothetical protein